MSEAIVAVTAISPSNPAETLQEAIAALPPQTNPNAKSFATMLQDGLSTVEDKVDHANELVRDFAVDESIPIHQVTIALEEARMSVELAMQVRQRLIEGYREIMNIQL